MNSRTISAPKGFLLVEIMIALSVFVLFMISTLELLKTMEILRSSTIKNLGELKMFYKDYKDVFTNYEEEWGKDNCYHNLSFNENNIRLYDIGVNIGDNISTDIEVRNDFVYLTADSSISSMPDFFIINASDPDHPYTISAINTGPGLSSLKIVGHYAYVSNLSTVSQLQIIDIRDRNNPVLISSFKLPLPEASSTASYATSIFYDKEKIYLGTKKSDGNEFSIIDVRDPSNPAYLGGFKTDTLINDIYINKELAFVADSDEKQMRILNIKDPSDIKEVGYFSPTGWETQQGKTLSYFDGYLSLGRTVGGFNNKNNHEIFLFSTSSYSTPLNSDDIPGGVYGIISDKGREYLAVKDPGKEFQIIDKPSLIKTFDYPLGFLPNSISCDKNNIYFSTGNNRGLAILKTE